MSVTPAACGRPEEPSVTVDSTLNSAWAINGGKPAGCGKGSKERCRHGVRLRLAISQTPCPCRRVWVRGTQARSQGFGTRNQTLLPSDESKGCANRWGRLLSSQAVA